MLSAGLLVECVVEGVPGRGAVFRLEFRRTGSSLMFRGFGGGYLEMSIVSMRDIGVVHEVVGFTETGRVNVDTIEYDIEPLPNLFLSVPSEWGWGACWLHLGM